jgi:hypothetical protein
MAIQEFLSTSVFSHISNSLGLYFFLALIPLIILYLIRPKPKQKTIPSLMFLIKQFQKSTRYSFLRTFLREFLFLIHLLLLILIAIAATHPFYESNESVDAEYTVIIIDNSASSGVIEGSSRFDRIIDEAHDALAGEEISIILAQNSPIIVLDAGEKADAIDVLNRIEPSQSLSALGTSMLAAGNLLEDKKGKIVVISDFVNTDSVNPNVAKKSLESRGQIVEFIDVKQNGGNIGIVDVDLSEDETKLSIKNYYNTSENVKMTINGEPFNIDILAGETEKVIFSHSPGLNTVKLSVDDNFEEDNTLQVMVPMEVPKNILFLSNNEQNYILPLLHAYKESWNEFIEIEEGTPPIIPSPDHDIYILTGIDKDKLPKAIIKQMLRDVEEDGATLIVGVQEDIEKFSFKGDLPVNLGSLQEKEALIFNSHVLTDVTSHISFGKTGTYLKADAVSGATTLAYTETGEDLIVVDEYGNGLIVYYGIFDDNSTFHYDISYPLFWQQLIDYIIGKDEITELNYKIGEVILFEKKTEVTTPSGKESKEEEIKFEETGIYKYQNKEVVVNLLNEFESQISFSQKDEFGQDIGLEGTQIKSKKSLTIYFIIAFLAFLFLELLYIKIRGDC